MFIYSTAVILLAAILYAVLVQILIDLHPMFSADDTREEDIES
jgi:hypothetical protein